MVCADGLRRALTVAVLSVWLMQHSQCRRARAVMSAACSGRHSTVEFWEKFPPSVSSHYDRFSINKFHLSLSVGTIERKES